MRNRLLFGVFLSNVLLVLAAPAWGGVFASAAQSREKIDLNARQTIDRLLSESDAARSLYERAIGYSVFNVTKVSLGITGGGGTGVAVDKTTGERVYMHMGTGGFNLGLGGQVMQLVFMFSEQKAFRRFVDVGWEASASANAVAGRAGANAGASFVNGLAVFQMTDAGLMLQVDISGTKYWRSKRLNGPAETSASR